MSKYEMRYFVCTLAPFMLASNFGALYLNRLGADAAVVVGLAVLGGSLSMSFARLAAAAGLDRDNEEERAASARKGVR